MHLFDVLLIIMFAAIGFGILGGGFLITWMTSMWQWAVIAVGLGGLFLVGAVAIGQSAPERHARAAEFIHSTNTACANYGGVVYRDGKSFTCDRSDGRPQQLPSLSHR